MRIAAICLIVPAFLAACGGTDAPDNTTVSSDVRIDGAEQANTDPDSTDARMCVNDDGHIFALWIDSRDGQPDIWFNRSLDNGATWLPTPVKINRGDSNVWAPTIACNDDNVYVAWEDDRDGELDNHQIYFSRSNDGGETWLEKDVLLEEDDDGLSMSYGPDIAAVGTSVFVTWYDNLNGSFDILVASSDDFGETWDEPVRVDSDTPAGSAWSGTPSIAVTEAGQVYVAWMDSRNGASDIYFTRSDNGGTTFKQDERLDSGDINCDTDVFVDGNPAGCTASFSPSIAADGNNVYVVWHDARGGEGRDVYLNYSGNGGADWLETDVRLDSGEAEGFSNSLYPVVVADGSTAHVAWQDARQIGYDIYTRTVEAGVPVDEEIRIDNGDEPGFNNSVNPKIAIGEGGTVVVAWEDGRGEAESGLDNGYNDLYYNYDNGEGYLADDDLRIDSIEPGQSFKLDMNIEVYGGWLFTTWVDGRNGTSDVYFHALQVGEEAEYIQAGATTTTPTAR